MKVNVITLENNASGSADLSDQVFGLPVRKDLLQRVVRWQLAKRQAGTHHTKVISDIRGTTAKPYRQKGTGRARQGSLRSQQFRGGAAIFGPKSRSHAHDLPKKVRKLGLKTALSAKAAEGKLLVVKDLALKDAKTAALKKQVGVLGWSSVLVIDGDTVEENFKRAAHNIPHLDVLPQQGANVYDILRRDVLVLTEAAVKRLEERLA